MEDPDLFSRPHPPLDELLYHPLEREVDVVRPLPGARET